MTYQISKKFTFEASHQLHGLPEGHKCMRLHGHSYRVVVVLKSETLDEHGFVVDYGELGLLKNYIDKNLDHRHLNNALDIDNPTAEKIAEHLYQLCKKWWPQTACVRVSETANTWAEYHE